MKGAANGGGPLRHKMIEDTVQIRCSRCKSQFRDKARRVVNGYSRQCPQCESIIFFDEGSPNPDIRKAVREATQVRKALREEELERATRQTTAPVADDEESVVSRRPTPSRKKTRGWP